MNTHLVLSGSANTRLGSAVAQQPGMERVPVAIERLPDGEILVRLEREVRGRPVAIVQPTGAPGGERLLELLLLADACRREGAGPLTAVVPYFGYARHDKRARAGEPLGARVVADVLGLGRFERIIAVDLHDPAIENGFPAPLDHLTAVPLLADAVRAEVPPRPVVVAPDLGAVKMAEAFARRLEAPLAIVHKHRISATDVKVSRVVGDVRGMSPILVDDIVSTAGTIAAAAEALLAEGCTPVMTVAATHALLVWPAHDRLRALPIRRFVSTDSWPQLEGSRLPEEVVPLAPLLAEAIRTASPRG